MILKMEKLQQNLPFYKAKFVIFEKNIAKAPGNTKRKTFKSAKYSLLNKTIQI